MPMLPPIETFLMYPLLLVVIVAAVVLPLIVWLRHLLSEH
jgi:hypothetical protein